MPRRGTPPCSCQGSREEPQEEDFEARIASLEQIVRDQNVLIRQLVKAIPEKFSSMGAFGPTSSSLGHQEITLHPPPLCTSDIFRDQPLDTGLGAEAASVTATGSSTSIVEQALAGGGGGGNSLSPLNPVRVPAFAPAVSQLSSSHSQNPTNKLNNPNERSLSGASGLLEFQPLLQPGGALESMSIRDSVKVMKGSRDFARELKNARRKSQASATFTFEQDEEDKTITTYNAEDGIILTIDACYLLCTIVSVIVTIIGLAGRDLSAMPPTYVPVLLGICQLLFAAWMYSRLFVRYRSSDWSVVDGYNRIKYNYMRTMFWPDLFLTLPFEFIFLGWKSEVFCILNVRHVLRIVRSFQLGALSSNPLNIARESFHLVLLLSLLLLVTHGCSVFFIKAASDKSSLTYVQGVYYVIGAFSTVGYQDSLTESKGAILFSLAVMLMGTVIIASTTAFVTRYMTSKDKLEADMEQRRAMLHSALTYYDIPWEIQKDIIRVLPSLLEQENQVEFRQILGTLPDSVGVKLDHFLRTKLLRQMPLFREISNSDALSQLSKALLPVHVLAQTNVILKGDEGNEMFIIVHGVVEVVVPVDDEDLIVATLSDGQFFGEIALLQNVKRTATVVTVTDCDFFILQKPDFLSIAHKFSEFANVVEKEVDLRCSLLHSSMISTKQHTTSASSLENKALQPRNRRASIPLDDGSEGKFFEHDGIPLEGGEGGENDEGAGGAGEELHVGDDASRSLQETSSLVSDFNVPQPSNPFQFTP